MKIEKIEKIGRAELRILSKVALRVVAHALAPYGVTVTHGRSQYSNGSTGTLRFELVVAGANPDRDSFECYAGLFGLHPSDYGRIVTLHDGAFRLVGIEPGRPKFPIVGERTRDNKRFKLTDDGVRRALEAGL